MHFNFNFSLLLLFFFLFTIEIYDNEFMLISEDASVDDNKRDGDDNTNAADGKENSAADMWQRLELRHTQTLAKE